MAPLPKYPLSGKEEKRPPLPEEEELRIQKDDDAFLRIICHWTWVPACAALVVVYFVYQAGAFAYHIFH